MDNTRVFRMAFASVYPHYIAKAEKNAEPARAATARHSEYNRLS